MGNGGVYHYYLCKNGCNETYQSNVLHGSFDAWLKHITLKPEIAALYFAIMEDVFKKNEGDRQEEVKKLQRQLDNNSEMINKSLKNLLMMI